MIRMTPQSRKVFIKLENLDKSMKKAIHGALCEIGAENVRHARGLLAEKKSGRIYRINGRTHQASAPYEPPANLSGDLSRSLGFVVSGSKQMEFGDKKQSGKAPYGLFLEQGTLKMKPRPHIIRTVRDQYKNTFNILIDSMTKAIK